MTHRPTAYRAHRLIPSGQLEEATLARRALVEDLGLKPRDIVSLFSRDRRLGFDLTVRNGSASMSLGRDGPAIIIGDDAAWILDQGSASQDRAGRMVQRQFHDVLTMAGSQPKQDPAFPPWPLPVELQAMPFSLTVAEAALVLLSNRLAATLRSATIEGAALLEGFYTAEDGSATVSTFHLEVLRRTKQRLDIVQAQAKALQQGLLDALGDEDDMMQLEQTLGSTAEEWELCFESYSHRAGEIGLEASRQAESLEDLESSISLSLSCRRLELEKMQIFLEVFGAGLSVGAMLTGAFGMNLMSGLETRRLAFWPACAMVFIASAAVSVGLRRFVNRRLRQQNNKTFWIPGGRWKGRASSPVGPFSPSIDAADPALPGFT